MAKKYKVGSLIKTDKEYENNGVKTKKTFLSIGLGQKNPKKPEWDQSVEVIIRNNKGDVIARQTDGFLDVVDPRQEPKELLAAGAIDEVMAEKMTENVRKLSDKVRYIVRLRAS